MILAVWIGSQACIDIYHWVEKIVASIQGEK